MRAPNHLAKELQDLRRKRELVQAAIDALERLHSATASDCPPVEIQTADVRCVRGDWILFRNGGQ